MQIRAPLRVDVTIESWRLRSPFRITGSTMEQLDVVVVQLEQEGVIARGEAAGVDYLREDVASMGQQIEAVRPGIESGISRESLLELLPPGGARNALDCALWELEAKRTQRAVWQMAGLGEPRALLTTYSIGAESPASMAATAQAHVKAKAIKLKLTGETNDGERVSAVRGARPDVWLGIDANQGFSRAHLDELMPTLIAARVALIEQPFPVGQEPSLDQLGSPIPIAADESVQGLSDLPALVARFNVINIKLDKCGGLTEALAMASKARLLGFDLMVGNMVGTSLAMAPAFLVGQLCQVVDLDGPILLKEDRTERAFYQDGLIHCEERVWGGLRRLNA
jgi:L-Ala-D/L-Glu epimerase